MNKLLPFLYIQPISKEVLITIPYHEWQIEQKKDDK